MPQCDWPHAARCCEACWSFAVLNDFDASASFASCSAEGTSPGLIFTPPYAFANCLKSPLMSSGAASASAFSASASLFRSSSPFAFGWNDCETFAARPSSSLQFLVDANDGGVPEPEPEPDPEPDPDPFPEPWPAVAAVVVPVDDFLLPHAVTSATNSTPSTTVTTALLRISSASCPGLFENLRRRASVRQAL